MKSASQVLLFAMILSFSIPTDVSAQETKTEKKTEKKPSRNPILEGLRTKGSARDGEAEQNAEQQASKKKADPALYPNATRTEPKDIPERSVSALRNKTIKLFNEKKYPEALASARELLASPNAAGGDKSTAMQIEVFSLRNIPATASADMISALKKAVDSNLLDNNAHYSLMLELAQRQFNEKDYAGALANSNKFIQETKTETAEVYLMRGNSNYRQGALPAAESDLKKAIQLAGDKADPSWMQLLARVLSDQGKKQEAAKLSESLAKTAGAGKQDQLNLAISYRDAKQIDKAVEVIDALVKKQELKETYDYRVGMEIYRLAKEYGKTADLIGQGIKTGALKEDSKLLNQYAESLYDAERYDEAVDVWKKAAPNTADGTSYLNLSIVLMDLQRFGEAKDAAQKALSKGLKSAADQKTARTVIANAERGG